MTESGARNSPEASSGAAHELSTRLSGAGHSQPLPKIATDSPSPVSDARTESVAPKTTWFRSVPLWLCVVLLIVSTAYLVPQIAETFGHGDLSIVAWVGCALQAGLLVLASLVLLPSGRPSWALRGLRALRS